MPKTAECDAKKVERLRLERRHYTVDLLGKDCPGCRHPMTKALIHTGFAYHPSCYPEDRELLRRM